MRFPRLSTLFHRRTKSDPEITRLASPPIAASDTGLAPISATSILSFSPSKTNSATSCPASAPCFLATPAQSAEPLTLSLSLEGIPPPGPAHPFHFSGSDPVRPSESVVALLTQRIRDLERALDSKNSEAEERKREVHASRSVQRVLELEAALRTERAAREVAEEACFELRGKVGELEGEVLQLRRDLFRAIVDEWQPAPTVANGRKGATVVAERDRLRHFVQLMVSVGGHKPVIGSAYQHVAQDGLDAESALVSAIKDAVAQPDSAWRGLLEPVTGARTQPEYLAQVRCTLDARKQTQDWRKKAKFWKGQAKEEGRHEETVTPSVSGLSDVVEILSKERRERAEGMLRDRRRGEDSQVTKDSPVAVYQREDSPDEELISAAANAERLAESLLPLSESFSGVHLALKIFQQLNEPRVSDTLSMASEDRLPACSSSMILPAPASITYAPSGYFNLPPLASETFRASHSIRSINSRDSRRGISTSSSILTQASARSRRWHANLVAIPDVEDQDSDTPYPSESLADLDEADMTIAVPEEDVSLGEACSNSSRGFSPLPKALVDFGKGSDNDLVLVLHSDFSDTSFRRAMPERCTDPDSDASGSTTPTSGRSSGVSTPEKHPFKSRLPELPNQRVRARGLNAIKRLSASIALSRPSLLDVNNTSGAPAPALVQRRDESVFGKQRAQTVSVRKLADSEDSVGGRQTVNKSTGRRLQQRFGI